MRQLATDIPLRASSSRPPTPQSGARNEHVRSMTHRARTEYNRIFTCSLIFTCSICVGSNLSLQIEDWSCWLYNIWTFWEWNWFNYINVSDSSLWEVLLIFDIVHLFFLLSLVTIFFSISPATFKQTIFAWAMCVFLDFCWSPCLDDIFWSLLWVS